MLAAESRLEENETVPDQKGKPTKRPTMRWIFFKFQGIKELITQKKGKTKSEILNMEEIHWKIWLFAVSSGQLPFIS